jgi:hypothetical protein
MYKLLTVTQKPHILCRGLYTAFVKFYSLPPRGAFPIQPYDDDTDIVPRFRPDARIQALHLLTHFCMDERVQGDHAILFIVQDTIEALMRTITGNGQLAMIVSFPRPSQSALTD